MSKNKGKLIHYECDPALFDGQTQFSFTIPPTRINILKPFKFACSPSLGQEVDELLKEWYGARGQAVPRAEVGIGAIIDAANKAEEATFTAAVAAAEEELPSVAPSYGTPEFWDYHRKKKALENKRRADAGLPPLPTKKELEAEKEKRRAEREAKKAAKGPKTIIEEITEMVDNLSVV
jgi:hypothetical protein